LNEGPVLNDVVRIAYARTQLRPIPVSFTASAEAVIQSGPHPGEA
jgi:hypothetical protein